MNPPDKMAVLKPTFCNTFISLSRPSVMGSLSAISLIVETSSPFSSFTLCLKLSSKSISPCMADSVIAFTLSPTPALTASSSITSVCISVESMSKQIRRRIRLNMLSC